MRKLSDLSFVLQAPAPAIDWELPCFSSAMPLADAAPRYRLWHVREIGILGAVANRLAMANVLGSLQDPYCANVYLLAGRPEGVSLYIGVTADGGRADLPEAAKALRAAFEGNFLGAQLQAVKEDDGAIAGLLAASRHLGLMTGVPTFGEGEAHPDGDDFQGLERLVNVMAGETWQLAITARPGSDADVGAIVEALLDLSGALSTRPRQSRREAEETAEDAGWTERGSEQRTRTERTNRSGESFRGIRSQQPGGSP